MNVEDYLRKYCVLDGMGNMDGPFVPLSIAMLAVKQILEGKLKYEGMSWIGPSPTHVFICKKCFPKNTEELTLGFFQETCIQCEKTLSIPDMKCIDIEVYLKNYE